MSGALAFRQRMGIGLALLTAAGPPA